MILNLIITSVLCVGTRIGAQELYHTFTKKDLDDHRLSKKWWAKPLWGCVTCFASLWGCFYYMLINNFDFEIITMGLNSIGLLYLNGLLYGIYERL